MKNNWVNPLPNYLNTTHAGVYSVLNEIRNNIPNSAADLTGTVGGSSATVRTPEQFGAAGNGTTDDTAAVNAALRAGVAGDIVRFAPGKKYLCSGVIGGGTTPVTAGITIDGYGATLIASDPNNSSLWIQADNVTVRGLRLTTINLGARQSGWEKYRFLAKDCANFRAHDITVEGASAAGVFMHNVNGFLLDHMTVRDALADGVHISAGSRNGLVVDPIVDNVGDDGVAIVSYTSDVNTVENIYVYSPRVWGQTNGRGISIVGGNNIWYYDVYVRRSYGAGIYIGNETGTDFNTKTVTNSGVIGGLVEEANYYSGLDHGGIFLLNQQTSAPVSDVLIRDITVKNMARSGQPFVNVKNSGTGGQFLRTTLANLRFEGRGNWLYPYTTDAGIVQNPTPYASANGATFTDIVWTAPQERGRQKTITGATTLAYDVEGATYICTGAGGYTVTLPTAGRSALDSEMARKITIFNAGTAAITVAGGGNVNGSASTSIPAKTGLTFINDGSAWWGW